MGPKQRKVSGSPVFWAPKACNRLKRRGKNTIKSTQLQTNQKKKQSKQLKDQWWQGQKKPFKRQNWWFWDGEACGGIRLQHQNKDLWSIVLQCYLACPSTTEQDISGAVGAIASKSIVDCWYLATIPSIWHLCCLCWCFCDCAQGMKWIGTAS